LSSDHVRDNFTTESYARRFDRKSKQIVAKKVRNEIMSLSETAVFVGT